MKITKEGRRIKIDIDIRTANMLMVSLVYSTCHSRATRLIQDFLKSILVDGFDNASTGDDQ
jgi:hypothetical protein